jgi:uncharacterized membrane protein YccC
MAGSRERLNARVIGGVVAIAAGLLYNVFRIDQPWIRLGQAWTLCVIVYLFGPVFERRRRRIGANQPCAEFLARQHEERERGYLRIRGRLFLLIPGIAASWWGGPAWLLVLTLAALILVWFAFGKAAKKAAEEGIEAHRVVSR